MHTEDAANDAATCSNKRQKILIDDVILDRKRIQKSSMNTGANDDIQLDRQRIRYAKRRSYDSERVSLMHESLRYCTVCTVDSDNNSPT